MERNLFPPAVILGLSPTGLYAIRELARAGIEAIPAGDAFGCAGWSRFASARERCWRVSDWQELALHLEKHVLTSGQKPVLMPVSDAFVELVCTHHEALSELAVFQASYRDGLATNIMDKISFGFLCEELGVEGPRLWRPNDGFGFREAAREADLPCLLKPKHIHVSTLRKTGEKVIIVRRQSEWDELIDRYGGQADQWLIQEVIPGPESNIFVCAMFVSESGEIVDVFSARKLRQHPPGFGSASLAISEGNSDVKRISRDFAKALGFRGVCGTEFKLDPRDGRYKIIEVNPRPTLWFHLSHAAEKRFAVSVYRDVLGLEAEPARPQVDGVLWRYGLKDLASQIFYRRSGGDFVIPPPEVDAHVASKAGKTAWCVWDPSDPMPILGETLQYVSKGIRRRWRSR